jgi:hypothetical protein
MMDTETTNMPEESIARDAATKVDQRRRILAKTGLVGPVVVGSLLSRPVLGQAPYNCTLSGQLSGGSTHGREVVCSTLGLPPKDYQQSSSWPAGLDPNELFKAVFADAYWYKYNKDHDLVLRDPTRGIAPATLLQVLNTTNTGMNSNNNYPGLGIAAVASWINASSRANYPLSPSDVVEMFNAVYNGGSYQVNSTVSLDAQGVKAYFESLY